MENHAITNLIKMSTLTLLQTKHIGSITITEIANKSYISRVTFYNYFQNKEEIIHSLISEITEGFDAIQKKNTSFLNDIDMSDTDQIKNTLFPNTLEIATFFKEKETLITGLLSENSGIQFMDILYNHYYQHFLTALPQVFFIKFAPDIIEFYATYMTKGIAALVESWFQSGFKSSAETISHAILNMLAPTLSDLYSEKRSLYRCS